MEFSKYNIVKVDEFFNFFGRFYTKNPLIFKENLELFLIKLRDLFKRRIAFDIGFIKVFSSLNELQDFKNHNANDIYLQAENLDFRSNFIQLNKFSEIYIEGNKNEIFNKKEWDGYFGNKDSTLPIFFTNECLDGQKGTIPIIITPFFYLMYLQKRYYNPIYYRFLEQIINLVWELLPVSWGGIFSTKEINSFIELKVNYMEYVEFFYNPTDIIQNIIEIINFRPDQNAIIYKAINSIGKKYPNSSKFHAYLKKKLSHITTEKLVSMGLDDKKILELFRDIAELFTKTEGIDSISMRHNREKKPCNIIVKSGNDPEHRSLLIIYLYAKIIAEILTLNGIDASFIIEGINNIPEKPGFVLIRNFNLLKSEANALSLLEQDLNKEIRLILFDSFKEKIFRGIEKPPRETKKIVDVFKYIILGELEEYSALVEDGKIIILKLPDAIDTNKIKLKFNSLLV